MSPALADAAVSYELLVRFAIGYVTVSAAFSEDLT